MRMPTKRPTGIPALQDREDVNDPTHVWEFRADGTVGKVPRSNLGQALE